MRLVVVPQLGDDRTLRGDELVCFTRHCYGVDYRLAGVVYAYGW